MTVNELDTLACIHGLHNFEVSSGRRPSEGIILRRNMADVITIVVKIDRNTKEITSKGIYVQTDPNIQPEWYELTDEQLKDLAFFVL